MPSQVTLAYSATGTNGAATLATLMGAVPLVEGERLLEFAGLTLESDSVHSVGDVVTRTLVFNLEPSAGTPLAPPFQVISTPPKGAQLAVFSTAVLDHEITGVLFPSGAHQVGIAYTDSKGNAGASFVLLTGKTPVVVPLAAGTVDFGGGIVGFDVTETGSAGVNLGQLTLSVIVPPEEGFPDFPPVNDVEAQIVFQDEMQTFLEQAVAMIPNGYVTLDPGFQGEILTNFFSQTLQLALATPVTASAPVFS